ncbi:Ubiquinone/menaquinone biosynthesis methyltransferase ubiE [Mycobacterium basiliense]|uniref:Ubiquinone/menaquinone biosynthesis methyltransferase ubiE n=1 Tax=Mycobacterium basiliense TaxID=2094119 RepID=A0A3S4CBQ7_9MYCO|nr:class I SAM-dependent methyltransferase [Mycobacterium basiliense]VDM88809.1 Ubiquinone/menaquinone biosynthesis methyltransferase ubiE [Mycobacterium basiliense]
MSQHGGVYPHEPADKQAYTARFDRWYSRLARPYDVAVKLLPVWRTWVSAALPHIRGPRVLEVSFGTGWLLTRYAANFETHGVDLNERMVHIARRNLQRAGVVAELRRANVEQLPYPDGLFDTVVNTMAFSGYPDGERAMSELSRMLRPQGRIVLVDIGYPRNGNLLGSGLIVMWKWAGDLIHDMPVLFDRYGLDVWEHSVGGFGSVRLYVATKR